jgi:polar amino acid transport system substrate-binding protein
MLNCSGRYGYSMFRTSLATTVLIAVLVVTGGRLACARDVEIAIGSSAPPYVIADEQRGIEYDIVKASLALEGHVMRPNVLPAGRVARALETNEVDAALTQRPEAGSQAHYSDVHIAFANAAITLAARNTKLERVEDLAGKSVVAYHGASSDLGAEFQAAVAGKSGYREEAKRTAQPILLFLDCADVVITDPMIFEWFSRRPEVADKADTSQPIRIHSLLPPTEYRVAFRDPALRDSFNRGLARLRQSGEYARIVARYSTLPGVAMR